MFLEKSHSFLQKILSLTNKKRRVGIRWHQFSLEESLAYLYSRAQELSANHRNGIIQLVSDNSIFLHQFKNLLSESNILFKVTTQEELIKTSIINRRIIAIFSLYNLESINEKIARFLTKNKSTSKIPFEYTFIPEVNYAKFIKYDQSFYSSTYFVSPLLVGVAPAYKIYEESLNHFEQKCDIRDFLDLFQAIENTVNGKIVGDIVEFGSYKGHSGYLIAKTLEHFNSAKRVYMYDMFDSFPVEANGLDAFWSKTHEVDFKDIESKFKDMRNVILVKGDFTKTFIETHPKKIALVYSDCDSYRSTHFILNYVFRKYVSRGGLVVVEDYGHPALLGNRIAVNEFVSNNRELFKYYSQFSGLFTFRKNQK